jgi:hypothetical protein
MLERSIKLTSVIPADKDNRDKLLAFQRFEELFQLEEYDKSQRNLNKMQQEYKELLIKAAEDEDVLTIAMELQSKIKSVKNQIKAPDIDYTIASDKYQPTYTQIIQLLKYFNKDKLFQKLFPISFSGIYQSNLNKNISFIKQLKFDQTKATSVIKSLIGLNLKQINEYEILFNNAFNRIHVILQLANKTIQQLIKYELKDIITNCPNNSALTKLQQFFNSLNLIYALFQRLNCSVKFYCLKCDTHVIDEITLLFQQVPNSIQFNGLANLLKFDSTNKDLLNIQEEFIKEFNGTNPLIVCDYCLVNIPSNHCSIPSSFHIAHFDNRIYHISCANFLLHSPPQTFN